MTPEQLALEPFRVRLKDSQYTVDLGIDLETFLFNDLGALKFDLWFESLPLDKIPMPIFDFVMGRHKREDTHQGCVHRSVWFLIYAGISIVAEARYTGKTRTLVFSVGKSKTVSKGYLSFSSNSRIFRFLD